MKKLTFLYHNAEGDTNRYTLIDWRENANYLQGFCPDRNATRTFRRDRIQSFLDGTDANLFEPSRWSAIRLGGRSGLEEPILFTGFAKADRGRLEAIAENAGLIVCKSISVNLGYLCIGTNAGPSKLQKAKKLGSHILTEQQFIDMIETGVLPEIE